MPKNAARKTATEKTATNIDRYIQRFPADVQKRLQQMRRAIKKTAPRAAETISYGIPAFRLQRTLVWFAAFENHIGFYPGADGIAAFKKELSAYKSAKGSVQFPLDEPLPLPLIKRIVIFRLQQ